MKNKFRGFLEENGYLPLSSWDSLEIKHGVKDNSIKQLIRKVVGTKEGLYVYIKGDRILYVGKAKSLFGRINSHYRESFEKVSGDTKWYTWHRFFSQKRNSGPVKVFWKEVGEESDRQILEKMIARVFNPEFEEFKERLALTERGK